MMSGIHLWLAIVYLSHEEPGVIIRALAEALFLRYKRSPNSMSLTRIEHRRIDGCGVPSRRGRDVPEYPSAGELTILVVVTFVLFVGVVEMASHFGIFRHHRASHPNKPELTTE